MIEIPKNLRVKTKKWFKSVLKDYDLEEHHQRILMLAAEAWDRIEEAREAITAAGAYYYDNEKPKAHPALKVEIDNKILFARLIRELSLDIEPSGAIGRPPGLY